MVSPLRTFSGYRNDPKPEYVDKGITNNGVIPDYEGVIYSDGTVAMRWMTEFRSHSVWASYCDFYRVHGHPEYGTVIVFHDGEAAPA